MGGLRNGDIRVALDLLFCWDLRDHTYSDKHARHELHEGSAQRATNGTNVYVTLLVSVYIRGLRHARVTDAGPFGDVPYMYISVRVRWRQGVCCSACTAQA